MRDWKLLTGKLLSKAVTMKIAVIFAVLAVLYCVAAEESKKEPASKENGENGKSEGGASTTASPQRARRSPPRFDANQMKGKYAKSNKIRRSLIPGFDLERARQQERRITDYLSPTPALLFAAQPPAKVKNQETTPSA